VNEINIVLLTRTVRFPNGGGNGI